MKIVSLKINDLRLSKLSKRVYFKGWAAVSLYILYTKTVFFV